MQRYGVLFNFKKMTEKNLAKIKPYFKRELADLYNVSVRKLLFWITNITEIKQIFEITGYKTNQRLFSLIQVEIIFKHLGHPKAKNEKEIHTQKRAELLPYSKNDLSKLYEISTRVLLSQIYAISDFRIKEQILSAGFLEYYKNAPNKKLFKKSEVELIFKYLGHPFKQN